MPTVPRRFRTKGQRYKSELRAYPQNLDPYVGPLYNQYQLEQIRYHDPPYPTREAMTQMRRDPWETGRLIGIALGSVPAQDWDPGAGNIENYGFVIAQALWQLLGVLKGTAELFEGTLMKKEVPRICRTIRKLESVLEEVRSLYTFNEEE